MRASPGGTVARSERDRFPSSVAICLSSPGDGALPPPRRLWSDGLLQLDRGVEKTIAALNQFFQPLGEACCRSPIDHLVIKADRQTQIVPDGDVPINDPRLLANAAHRHPEGMGVGWRNAPATPFPKHAHCRESHRPHQVLPHLVRRSNAPEGTPEAR